MTRLDAALAARGLARSRSHAATLISEGLVSVDGRPVVKASTAVDDAAEITIAGADHYVGRAAHKLIAGLDGFAIPVQGRLALDMGASTGASPRCCGNAEHAEFWPSTSGTGSSPRPSPPTREWWPSRATTCAT